MLDSARTMIAWVNGFLGVAGSLGIGLAVLGRSPEEIAWALAAVILAGFLALLLTLQAESVPWIRRRVLNRSLVTWTFFLSVYYGVQLALAPMLREPRVLAWMSIPLVLSNGFSILAFGPLQDWVVARRQRQARRALELTRNLG